MTNVTFLDLVKFQATAGGTGSFAVSSAITGFQTPATASAVGGQQFHYRAESTDLTQWEIGSGTYTSSNVTLSRTPLINVSGGSSAYNFSVAPQVGFVVLAEDWNGVGQLVGTNTNDSASAGNVGEYVSANVASGSAVTLTTAVPVNVTSVSLSAGNWELHGNVIFQPGAAAVPSGFVAWISSASATTPTPPNSGGYSAIQGTFATGGTAGVTAGFQRVSLASSQTFFLGALATFSSGVTAYGFLEAWRRR